MLTALLVVASCGSSPAPPESASKTVSQSAWQNASASAAAGTTPLSLAPVDPANGPGRIAWSVCTDEPEALCGTVAVPKNDVDATDGNLDLAVELVPARNRNERIGALLYNPGGPGGVAVGSTPIIVSGLAASIQDRFDIVGFDPRGRGESAPLKCASISDVLARRAFLLMTTTATESPISTSMSSTRSN